MEDNIFKQDAKSMVDQAFNKNLFVDELTRDDMNAFENLIAHLLQSRFDGYVMTEELMKRLKDK